MEAIEEARAGDQRTRAAPAWLMIYFSLALWFWPRVAYEAVWARLVDGLAWAGHHHAALNPRASSISRARDRLGPEPLQCLFRRLTPTARPDRLTMDITHLDVRDPCGFGRAQIATLTDPGSGALVDVTWAPDSVPLDDLPGRLTYLRGHETPIVQVTHQALIQRIIGRGQAMLRSNSGVGVDQEIYALACVYQAVAQPDVAS